MKKKSLVFECLVEGAIIPFSKPLSKNGRKVQRKLAKVGGFRFSNTDRKNSNYAKTERPNYFEYIKSPRWRSVKKRYYEKFGKKCVICSSPNVGLHHISYERLGNEEDRDLVAFCWGCHAKYHDIYGVRKANFDTNKFIEEEVQNRVFSEIVKNL